MKMTNYLPKHGDRTHKGIWFDNRPIDATSTWDDMLDSAHTPDCDVAGCSYNALNFTNQPRTWGELTYHGDDGLWLCATHWAEFYDYKAPALTPYGGVPGRKGEQRGE